MELHTCECVQRSLSKRATHSVSSWVVERRQQKRLRRAASRYVAPLHMPGILPCCEQLQRLLSTQDLPASCIPDSCPSMPS